MLALPAFLSSVISSFLPKISGERGEEAGPPQAPPLAPLSHDMHGLHWHVPRLRSRIYHFSSTIFPTWRAVGEN